MPELICECGKRVKFPPGTEGKRGKCPHCRVRIQVPGTPGVPAQKKVTLDPPPSWDEYKAYLEDRGPAPQEAVMPPKLMLQTEADERWERRAQVRPSKFFCPACRERINVDQVICTACGLDYRSGTVLGKDQRLNAKGMRYLEQIPWLDAARAAMSAEPPEAPKSKTSAMRAKAPRKRRKRR